MDQSDIFSRYKEEDYVIISPFKENSLRPISLAHTMIDASEYGTKPINFRLGTPQIDWQAFTTFGPGRKINSCLDFLGYQPIYQINSTSDGLFYILQKKG